MKKTITTVVGAAAGVVLALVLAGPASASSFASAAGPSTGPDTNPADSPALQQWLGTSTVTAAPTAASSSASPQAMSQSTSRATSLATAAATPTGGERITQKHGGALLWTSNTLEWYYNSSTITSSSGSQAVGYIFPNTASKGGIQRTLATAAQHNWRGTNIIGTGVVTPWGAVNVYRDSLTDYYTLERGGKYIIN